MNPQRKKSKTMAAVYFDMDGTIANFYGVNGWLDALHVESVMPYVAAEPLVNPNDFVTLIEQLKNKGYTVGIISWSAMNGSKEYNKRVRAAKLAWVKNYFGNIFDEFHVVKYGTPKHTVASIKNSIIVDDDSRVRGMWKNGEAIDASDTCAMMESLEKLAA